MAVPQGGRSSLRTRPRRGPGAQACHAPFGDLLLLLVAVPGAGTWLVDVKPLLFFFFKKYFSTYLLFFSLSVCSVQNQTVLLTAPWGL